MPQKSEHRRIYIAGPMAGVPESNYPAFNAAAAKLRAAGWTVENLVDIGANFGPPEAIQADHRLLARVEQAERDVIPDCDAIYLLRGWHRSAGARGELAVALKYDLAIVLQPEGSING